MVESTVTFRGTPNIALIKYWGKRNDKLILPCNSSISLTLKGETKAIKGTPFNLYTKTSVLSSDKLTEDAFYINGQKQDLADKDVAERFYVINQLRTIARSSSHILVVSQNTFPTASGLASSASGIATLIHATSKALGLNLSEKELSIIARQGSGSSCRSVIGGIVKWDKGKMEDGSDSFAHQLYPANYWPDLVDIIAIVSSAKKKVPSRAGMAQTVKTSLLHELRLKIVEDKHIAKVEEALKSKDLSKLAEIVMKESNNMHATMLDTSPPIMYLDDNSKAIIYAIEDLNKKEGKVIAGYTFDAGANAHIITVEGNVDKVANQIKDIEGVESIVVAGIGNGPEMLSEEESLIDAQRLAPK
jgi:diphosphomevalonate decarboxylase